MGPQELKLAETILGAGAGVSEAVGSVREGKAQAAQLEANAAAARAKAAATAAEERRQGRLAESAALAAQAAAGGGTATPQAQMQRARIDEVSGTNALAALFEGDVRATSYENQARSARQQGTLGAFGAGLRTVSTVLKNTSDIYDLKKSNKPKRVQTVGATTSRQIKRRYMTDQGSGY